MNMNQTPMSERVHIGFFGKRNAGKSSVMNAVTGQDLAVVSEVKGTTTDPVYKSMELLPLGPVVMMDTPGIDDEGELGGLRVRKSYQVLNKTDAAVLVIDGQTGASGEDAALLRRIRKKNIPYTVVLNKQDLAPEGVLNQTAGILDIPAEQILGRQRCSRNRNHGTQRTDCRACKTGRAETQNCGGYDFSFRFYYPGSSY